MSKKVEATVMALAEMRMGAVLTHNGNGKYRDLNVEGSHLYSGRTMDRLVRSRLALWDNHPDGTVCVTAVPRPVIVAANQYVITYQVQQLDDALTDASLERLFATTFTTEPVCNCSWDSEDRGGGYFELVVEVDPDCPEHGRIMQQITLDATRNVSFDEDDFYSGPQCCTGGDCCGPGSYCCSRTGPHTHPEMEGKDIGF